MHAVSGDLNKMRVQHDTPVSYWLPVGGDEIALNDRLGSTMRLTWSGAIHCIACGRTTKKSFNQGYCYPCFRGLARCDTCITRPECCHFHAGTCREPQWGLAHCMQPHVVYLANSSGVKVGITRSSQVPVRWIDQGAVQALPIFTVRTRLQSGIVEVAMKRHIADRTDWRAMLRGDPEPRDLTRHRAELVDVCGEALAEADSRFEAPAEPVDTEPVREFSYPVLEYPLKVKAHNFDKTPRIEGTLQGVKGQYLILDTGVLNVRKFGGYEVEVGFGA